jgi:hypothetical protein
MEIIEKYFIQDFFKDQPTGRFLEIGAKDGEPDMDSEPMWTLVEKGWSGVYCEPNPISCASLIENILPYKDKIQIFNGAISLPESPGRLEDFHLCFDIPSISSFDVDWQEQTTKGDYWLEHFPHLKLDTNRQISIITNTVTFQTLIDKVGNDFDCISIDIETGLDKVEELIMSIDWGQFKNCKLLCLETSGNKYLAHLEKFGFTSHLVTKNNNIICLKKPHTHH